MNEAPEKLSETFRDYCAQGEDAFFLSIVSPWEIQIKQQLGKLNIASDVRHLVEKNQQENGIKLLTIELNHIHMLGQLPSHHHDPFDRLLIAQAKAENMSLVTADERIRQYDVDVVW